MAYKSTGRPVGRPKTKEYVTMLARVPVELADLVKRYAAEHGSLPVAELIREGLEWRIGDGDPRGTGMYLSQPTGIREKEYSSNTGNISGDEALQEVRILLTRQWEQIQTLAQAIERQRVPTSDGVYSSNTSIGHTEPGSTAEHTSAEESEGFDPARFRLGKLCKRGHAYQDTGQTLYRLPRFVCPECDAEGARERRKAKREKGIPG